MNYHSVQGGGLGVAPSRPWGQSRSDGGWRGIASTEKGLRLQSFFCGGERTPTKSVIFTRGCSEAFLSGYFIYEIHLEILRKTCTCSEAYAEAGKDTLSPKVTRLR